MNKKLFFCLILINVFYIKAQRLQTVIDSLQKELICCKTDSSKIKILDALSFSFSKLNPDKGLQYALQLKELSTVNDNMSGLAAAYSNLGLNYAAKADYKKAATHYLNAIKVYKVLGNKRGQGAVFANMCLLFLNQSEYNKALEYAFDALSIFESIKDYSMMAIVQENIGTIYLEQKKFQKTLYYYSLSYENFRKISDITGMARVIGNKGIVLNEKGEYQEAMKCHLMALKNNQLIGLKRSEQINLANIAITYSHLTNYEKALEYHLKALEISKQLKDKKSIGINLGNAGEVYYTIALHAQNSELRNENLKKGISFLKEAIDICRDINFMGPLVEYRKYLSDAYSLAGMYELALNEYKGYTKDKDSVYTEEIQTEIASLETKRELALKDKEITLKKQQKEILLLEEKNTKNERIIYLISIALLSAIIFMMYIFLRNRSISHVKVLDEISHTQSHNVRAPLARILGLISIIDYENQLSRQDKQILKHIRNSALELDDVIKDVVNKANVKQRKKGLKGKIFKMKVKKYGLAYNILKFKWYLNKNFNFR